MAGDLLRSTYTKKLNLIQCVQPVHHNIKEIIYAFNVKNHNIIKIFYKIKCLVLMSSLFSRHWSCIYFIQPELTSIELKVLSSNKLLSFPHLMILLLDFNVGNHFPTLMGHAFKYNITK